MPHSGKGSRRRRALLLKSSFNICHREPQVSHCAIVPFPFCDHSAMYSDDKRSLYAYYTMMLGLCNVLLIDGMLQSPRYTILF